MYPLLDYVYPLLLCKGPVKVLVTSGTALREGISISKNPKTHTKRREVRLLTFTPTFDESRSQIDTLLPMPKDQQRHCTHTPCTQPHLDATLIPPTTVQVQPS